MSHQDNQDPEDRKPSETVSSTGQERLSIRDATVEKYTTILREYSRPPSRGGDTKARHSHGLLIDGQRYTFLVPGSRKWVFAGDTVSFDYVVTPEDYRNVVEGTLVVRDKTGKEVIRGIRERKQRLRSTPYRR